MTLIPDTKLEQLGDLVGPRSDDTSGKDLSKEWVFGNISKFLSKFEEADEDENRFNLHRGRDESRRDMIFNNVGASDPCWRLDHSSQNIQNWGTPATYSAYSHKDVQRFMEWEDGLQMFLQATRAESDSLPQTLIEASVHICDQYPKMAPLFDILINVIQTTTHKIITRSSSWSRETRACRSCNE